MCKLNVAHYRQLHHYVSGGIIAGWEDFYNHTVRELEDLGLLRGEWGRLALGTSS